MTDDTQLGRFKLQKLDPKAWIGYLVGYRSSNIYRIWIPSTGRVISTRDVVFDEETVFDGSEKEIMDNLMHSTTTQIAEWMQSIELPEPTHEPPEEQTFYEDEPSSDWPTQSDRQSKQHNQQTQGLLTPPETPPPVALLTQLMVDMKMEDQFSSTKNQPTSKTIPWKAAFMAGTQAGVVGTYNNKAIDKAELQRRLATGIKVHRKDLPELPTSFTRLDNNQMEKQWREAQQVHLQSHHTLYSWKETPAKPVKQSGQQILDCMWVYTYKLDKHNQFIKCKARLVVRGDQQRNVTSEETYAATLASHSFRMLMAIAAKHDMELKQFDISNAFVHATIDRKVFMRMPPGYQKPGTILQLQKALYGLRISPLLWQKNFTAALTKLGYKTVPHEPCCMIKDGILVFFYVDDIIFAYSKEKHQEYQHTVNMLKEEYSMTGGEDLHWFLGMEVIRDRDQRLISLSQAAYIEKIARLIDRRDIRHDTPMGTTELMPYEELATPSAVNKYQCKIGSMLFAAVTTRPDIAFATSCLARFLVNPSPTHHDAADRVLLYLESTKYLVLTLGGGTDFEVASDASFADNTLDRKSSQAYIIKLFGGVIAWRANKQDMVTTSTTEAELLALSQAAKEAMYISRLIRELDVALPDESITIQCDNQQTVRLITAELAKLQTKLRHVDIHNHWLRQEQANDTIKVVYTPTTKMLADGLTKALPPNKWRTFIDQMGLTRGKNPQRLLLDLVRQEQMIE
jgi:hypothetical protein